MLIGEILKQKDIDTYKKLVGKKKIESHSKSNKQVRKSAKKSGEYKNGKRAI